MIEGVFGLMHRRWMSFQVAVHASAAMVFFLSVWLIGEKSDGNMSPFSFTAPGLLWLYAIGFIGGILVGRWHALISLPAVMPVPWFVWALAGAMQVILTDSVASRAEFVFGIVVFPIFMMLALGIPVMITAAAGVASRLVGRRLWLKVTSQRATRQC